MNPIKKILLFVIAVVYLFLSTGVTLLQTHCLCSDSTRISLYAASESCNEIISDDGYCDEENKCQDIPTGHKDHSCGCDEPIVTYLKLTNHPDEGSNLEYSIGQQLTLVHFREALTLQLSVFSTGSTIYPDYYPPEDPLFGRFLIAFLNQRKIALTA